MWGWMDAEMDAEEVQQHGRPVRCAFQIGTAEFRPESGIVARLLAATMIGMSILPVGSEYQSRLCIFVFRKTSASLRRASKVAEAAIGKIETVSPDDTENTGGGFCFLPPDFN